MSYLSSAYTAPSLNGVIELTDGTTVISGGNISGSQSITTENLTINNNLDVPEITTGNIQSINNSLVIGDINDSITIYGNDIRFIGNVTSFEPANVLISDHNLDLNYGGGNLFLQNAGINILGDSNITVSSLTTDAYGEWSFSSPNGNLTVGTLKASNVEVENISFDNLSAGNIEATNRFITQERAFLNKTTSYSSAVTHLNCNEVKTNLLRSTGNSLLWGGLSNYQGQLPFKIQYGTTATVTTSVTITFDVPFTVPPTVLVSAFINSSDAPVPYIRGITETSVNFFAKDNANNNYGNLKFTWLAIGI
jgi:hypothetical protein